MGFIALVSSATPLLIFWSWALEWNGTTRLTVFSATKVLRKQIVDSLRKLQMDHHNLGSGDYVRSRIDVPLHACNAH